MNGVNAVIRGVVCTAALLAQAPAPPKPVIFPFEFYRNAIWFDARVNGSRPLHVLFDTAAGSFVLNRPLVDELKLRILTEFDQPNAGSGDRPTRITIASAAKIEFASVALDLPQIAALPLDQVASSYGAAIDGIIGSDLMARYVVRVDFDARTLELLEPATFKYAGAGSVLPLEPSPNSREPIVRGRFSVPGAGVVEGRFLVDEPHPHCLLFATPFSREHSLPQASEKYTSRLVSTGATGVGGLTPYRVGRLEFFELGGFRLPRPTAGFAESKGGAFARTDIAGIIGGEILRRFRLTFDLARNRLILEPGRALDDPFTWDASGLRLRAMGADFRRFEVVQLVENSPATDAGVQVGDVIGAIDGRPAAGWTLAEIQRLFQTPDLEHTLSLERDGRTRTVVLKTRTLI